MTDQQPKAYQAIPVREAAELIRQAHEGAIDRVTVFVTAKRVVIELDGRRLYIPHHALRAIASAVAEHTR